jgi:predicted dehydrogenase
LKTSTAAVSAAALATWKVPNVHAAGSDIIRIGTVGCGSRCPGAALQAMNCDPGVRLVAMTDVFADRVAGRRQMLKAQKPEQVQVDDAHCFHGLGGYRQVIDAVDVVLIACAAKFHPMYMMAAIQAGKHVFVEKPHAIDPAGVHVVAAACDLARKKGLSVMSGLHSRHQAGYQETMRRIHDGAIGQIVAIEENFLRGPYGLYPRLPQYQTEVAYQLANQYHFTWLCGDDVAQSLVHNVDRATWAMQGQVPVKAHGLGGRSSTYGNEIYGNVFDHHSVVYEYANGVRLYAFCRTALGCYNEYSSIILGSKGRANLMACRIEGETKWHYARRGDPDGHQVEHNVLFEAIRSGQPVNSGDYMTQSTMVAVFGQLSCYSGREVTWDQAMKSDFVFLPRPEDVRLDMSPPVTFDKALGDYPVCARPGITKIL